MAVFRCDGTAAIGAGHVTRCLALAEALEDAGWRTTFVVNEEAPSLVPALAAGAFRVRIIDRERNEIEILRQEANGAAELLVLDHYQRDARLESACRPFIQKILVLDDATGRDHDCDILLDAAAPDPAIYAGHVPAPARVLTGPAYALIRRAFVEKRPKALARRDDRAVKEILVSFGATDPSNATSVALAALEPFADDISIVVALSSRAQHLDDVRRRLRGRMRLALDAEMTALMTEADIAIGAAGASSYERAVLGLPSITVTLADNQRGITTQLTEAGAAIDAGPFDRDLPFRLRSIAQTLIGDADARVRVAKAAAALVDWRGRQRLMVELVGETRTRLGSSVRLRLAEERDSDWLLDLQRAPQTRRYSRNPAVPGVQEHASWMKRTLANPEVFLLVIDVNGIRAGSLRLDRMKGDLGNEAFEISVAVCPNFHGRGIARVALSLARRVQPAAVFDAVILPENIASRALFARAGFRQVGATRYRQAPDDAGPADMECR